MQEREALANMQEVVANMAAELQRVGIVACELLGRNDTVNQQIAVSRRVYSLNCLSFRIQK